MYFFFIQLKSCTNSFLSNTLKFLSLREKGALMIQKFNSAISKKNIN